MREIVEKVNERIREAIRVPPPGPALHLFPYDVEQVVREWRSGRDG